MATSRRTGAAGAPRRRRLSSHATTLALCLRVDCGPGRRYSGARRCTSHLVAPTILAEPASQAALAIQVGPGRAVPSNSFVRLRGLPASVSLTEGHAIAPGSWAVPLFGLPALKAMVPAGVSGRAEIIIHLVGVDGATLAETRTAFIIGPATIIAPADKSAAEARATGRLPTPAGPPPPAKSAQPAPELPPGERERAERLVSQGERHLEQGNIGAARMFFQRAAEAGLAAGAVKMAATYDPVELERLKSGAGRALRTVTRRASGMSAPGARRAGGRREAGADRRQVRASSRGLRVGREAGASGRSARARTDGAAAQCRARDRSRACPRGGSGRTATAPASCRARRRCGRSPPAHTPSRSADAGIPARSAASSVQR